VGAAIGLVDLVTCPAALPFRAWKRLVTNSLSLSYCFMRGDRVC